MQVYGKDSVHRSASRDEVIMKKLASKPGAPAGIHN